VKPPRVPGLFDEPENRPTRPGPTAREPAPAPPVSAPPVSAPPVSAPPVSAPPVSAPPVSAPPISALPGSRENPFTVAAINTAVRLQIEERWASVWIVGELSNFSGRSSGHWYFTLKDAASELSAAMFSRENRSVKFEPRDGLEVLARGRLTVYAARGRYQFVVEEILPHREGALQLAFRQLEERLRAEGLFDPAKRRPIPLLPRRIGLVTSRDGAAFRDILRVLGDRFASVTVILRACRVQGEGAAEDIAAGIRDINEHGQAEVLIVGRGGGSLEDLWAFNEEAVVRAIAGSRIPVISAVGHEVDVTLADLAADLRAATPSAAAEKVIASRAELSVRISRLMSALVAFARAGVESRRRRAEALGRSRALRAEELRVRDLRQRVDELSWRLRQDALTTTRAAGERLGRLRGRMSPRALSDAVRGRGHRLDAAARALLRGAPTRFDRAAAEFRRLAGLLNSLSPLAVLERGYAICFDAAGQRVVRDSATVAEGETVRVKLEKGRLDCRVTGRSAE